jgi:aldehyde:ferredoxin oxidoreductase
MSETTGKIGGMQGKLLRVNLTTGQITTEMIPAELVARFLGARGLGAYYLYKEVGPTVNPLEESNKLIFFNGPLAGSMMPGDNKVCVTFKSPLSQSYSFSMCGGHWGPELKYAGYDGLIIEGKSPAPVYLWIDNSKVELKSAASVWGKIIPESDRIIRQELGPKVTPQIAIIGPAGENGNKFATITCGLFREFGRGGAGTVMGKKMLKAIAIRGTQDISFHDPETLANLSIEFEKNVRNAPMSKVRRQFGTPELVKKINDNGFWCTRNFMEGYFEEGFKLEGPQMRKDVVVGDASCFGCPVGCGKRSLIKSEKYGEIFIEGPEFETIGLLGANCGISDWGAIMKATQICDYYGFDTINAGACVSFIMECYQKGLLTADQTEGKELNFGNGDALVILIQWIADRHGIGDILADGLVTAGEKFHAPNLAMHSKGQAFAVYDPRGCKGMALTYATSPKGAHHMIATTMGIEINAGNRLSIKDKGHLQKVSQISMVAADSLGICSTMRAGFPLQDQVKAFTAITGISMTETQISSICESIINLERMYNVRLGFSRKNDTLPKRMLSEPFTIGESKGSVVELDALLDDYYTQMGWDANGIPTPEKLQQLGLSQIVH